MTDFKFRPTACVQAIPVDCNRKVLLHHRSDQVRSAKNVWSFPTGILEYNETLMRAAARELKEEFDLETKAARILGCYENRIDDFHWVLTVVGLRVPDVYSFINMEPDKHDIVEVVHLEELLMPSFFDRYAFHDSFRRWFEFNSHGHFAQLHQLTMEGLDYYGF
jgi:8-oxo-dGTP pyrophosphatase MutT (NUDIX family)